MSELPSFQTLEGTGPTMKHQLNLQLASHLFTCFPIDLHGNITRCTLKKYCPLLKKMQLTYTAWVEFLKICDDGRGRIYRFCQNSKSLTLHDLLSTGRYLLVFRLEQDWSQIYAQL